MDAFTARRFAQRHFEGTELGDRRRTQRLIQVAAAFASAGSGQGGGGTITSVIGDPYQAKAAYRLLDREELTHPAVVAGHCQLTLEATAGPGDYLLIEDTTVVSYPNRKAATGLGPVGAGFTRGLLAHSTLAVRVDWRQGQGQMLGLLGQKVWARPPERHQGRRQSHGRGKESEQARQQRAGRESERWMTTLEKAGGAMAGTTWTYVADRESDIYELFQSSLVNGWSHVIRATHRRALAGAWEGSDLFEAAAQSPLRGQVEVALPRQHRTAQLAVRSAGLELRGPRRAGIEGRRLENHALHVVYVREIASPPGLEPVAWVLLTDLPVETLQECLRIIQIYRWRWLIEELHKALKTGLKIEASQLSTARRLEALIGVLSVVATMLVGHKLQARIEPEAKLIPGEADPVLVEVLQKVDPPQGQPTRRWFWVGIAKLGGFQARKSDGDPGWLTLWRGWQVLMLLARGYELARGP
jgi:hypothetical protein